MNEQALFWLILAVVLGVVEICTTNLVTIWPAFAAVITAFVASADVGVAIQGGVFIVASGVLLVLTRPIVKKFLNKRMVSTNADRIIGAEGIVIEPINILENRGQIKVMGQIWSAKSESGENIEAGKVVVVKALEGVKVIVSEVDK